MSNSLQPHEQQHTRIPCPSPVPGATQTHVCHVSDAIQPSHPLSSPSPSASIRVFSNESVLHISWPKIGSFSFSISPSNEYSGPISFRIDWLDLLVVQGALKSLLQHYSSKASLTNLDSILESRDITLLTMIPIVRAMVFPIVVYGCERWTIKKAEC